MASFSYLKEFIFLENNNNNNHARISIQDPIGSPFIFCVTQHT